MSSEKQWVASLLDSLREGLGEAAKEGGSIRVESGHRLSYAYEVLAYGPDGEADPRSAGYETDILISDVRADATWTPRVVIECKTGSVTTHDALTYSAKASTHKHVHPYLRYGILIGNYGEALPARLVRHGAYFDFMTVWSSEGGSALEWRSLLDVLREEIAASRTLQDVLTDRSWSKKKYRLLHRPLRFQQSGE